MNIGESLPRNAQHFPGKPALADSRMSLTFAELDRRTNRLGNYLLGRGIGKGDRVALSCGNRAEHLEALFALAKIGAAAVPFDYHWSELECDAMLRFFAPKAFIAERRTENAALMALAGRGITPDRRLVMGEAAGGGATPYEAAVAAGAAGEPPVRVTGADPFLIMITSGTTGFPKACSIDHQTYALRSLNYAVTRGFGQNERALFTLPLHFNAGRGSAMSLLYLGGTVRIQEQFDERRFLETIESEKITYTMLVPTLCERLLRSGLAPRFDTSSLAFAGITGGHLADDTARGIMETLCPELYESYASTDCGQMTLLSPEERFGHPGSVGRPIWCVLFKFADDDGKPAPPGSEGEICVQTPMAIQGYYENPEATAAFLRDGWCHTGDIGHLGADGHLYISGRKKSMVKSGGISIFPEEIEAILRRHPQVVDVAVVGFKSPEWGEAVKAFVVLRSGERCAAAALIDHCKQSMAPYKAPKAVEFVAALPRTGLGKLDRVRLEALQNDPPRGGTD